MHIKMDRFKLLYLDIGLLQTATQVNAARFFEEDIMQINAGMIAEQFVGQELVAHSQPYQNSAQLFWERTNGGQAEVDFVLTIESEVIPVEVKAGATGSLRSLHSFLKEKKGRLGVRIAESPLQLTNNVLSVPFYLLSSLQRLVIQALNQL